MLQGDPSDPFGGHIVGLCISYCGAVYLAILVCFVVLLQHYLVVCSINIILFVMFAFAFAFAFACLHRDILAS